MLDRSREGKRVPRAQSRGVAKEGSRLEPHPLAVAGLVTLVVAAGTIVYLWAEGKELDPLVFLAGAVVVYGVSAAIFSWILSLGPVS